MGRTALPAHLRNFVVHEAGDAGGAVTALCQQVQAQPVVAVHQGARRQAHRQRCGKGRHRRRQEHEHQLVARRLRRAYGRDAAVTPGMLCIGDG